MNFTVDEMKRDMPIPLSMLSISFLQKLPYKGSYKGKRFMLRKREEDAKSYLEVYVWEDFFNFENTEEENIKNTKVDFSKEGIEEGLEFIAITKV